MADLEPMAGPAPMAVLDPIGGVMRGIYRNVLDAIGDTPLVQLNRVVGRHDARVLAKLEFMNPGGSVKDRMALHIIEEAERSGELKPGSVIVENTSGNTGVAVAMAAAVKGYRCIFTMPDKMSKEKVDTLKGLGAEVIVTPTNVPADSPESYYETAKRLARETPNAFYVNQYHTKDNIEAHYLSTGPEIWRQLDGKIDAFVAGIGTGGTMSGAGKFFKEKNPDVKNVGVDPIGSIYHSMFHTGKPSEPHVYKVEGIGEDMVCGAMELEVMDDVRQVDDKTCFTWGRRLAREEGIFAGGSAGGAVAVAVQLARELGKGKIVVAVLSDGGRAYISKMYSDEWMRDNGFLDDSKATVRDLLGPRRGKVESAARLDRAADVVDRMKRFGYSQLPIVDATGACVGMVHEVDLLDAIVGGKLKLSDTIEAVVHPLQGAVKLDTPVAELPKIFGQDNVAVVLEGARCTAIVTKIDLIDWLGRRPARA